MKNLTPFLLFAFIIFNIHNLSGQDVAEIPFKLLDKDFEELYGTLYEIDKTDDRKSIDLSVNALKKFSDPDLRYHLIFWELSFHYANIKQYDKCFGILKKGQKEGMFYYITKNDRRTFPAYIEKLEKLDGYKSFFGQNQALKEEAHKTMKTAEFMLQFPENYNENNKYPLFFIMPGGLNDFLLEQYFYKSTKLQKDFIVAFSRSHNIEGKSGANYYRHGVHPKAKKIFDQIISKYPVDTSSVILAGPSYGGLLSQKVGFNNLITAKGLILSFTTVPDLDSTAYINSAERGLRVAMICGENDWAIKRQKKLGYLLDKYDIENRFVVFPDKGHEFPDNWPHHLDTSIGFILEEEK